MYIYISRVFLVFRVLCAVSFDLVYSSCLCVLFGESSCIRYIVRGVLKRFASSLFIVSLVFSSVHRLTVVPEDCIFGYAHALPCRK